MYLLVAYLEHIGKLTPEQSTELIELLSGMQPQDYSAAKLAVASKFNPDKVVDLLKAEKLAKK